MNSLQTTYTSDSLLAAYPSSSLVSNPNSNKRNFEDEVILSTSLNPLEQLTSIVEQQHAWAMLADGSPTKRRRTSPDPSRRPSLDNQHGILQRPSSPLEALVMALESFSPECDMTTEDFVKNETGDMSYSGQHAVHHSPGRRRSSASGERKVYACEFEGCGKQFMQLAHLRIHERCHTGLRPYVCEHPGCDKAFTQLGNLKTHERKHTGERPYKCSHAGCEKSFTQLGNLKTHERIHASVKPFICDIDGCGKGFSQLGNLKTHQNKMHSSTIIEFKAKTLLPLRERQILPAPPKKSSSPPPPSPPTTPLPLPDPSHYHHSHYFRAQPSGVRRDNEELRLLYKVKIMMQKKAGRRGDVPLLVHEDDGSEVSDELME